MFSDVIGEIDTIENHAICMQFIMFTIMDPSKQGNMSVSLVSVSNKISVIEAEVLFAVQQRAVQREVQGPRIYEPRND